MSTILDRRHEPLTNQQAFTGTVSTQDGDKARSALIDLCILEPTQKIQRRWLQDYTDGTIDGSH